MLGIYSPGDAEQYAAWVRLLLPHEQVLIFRSLDEFSLERSQMDAVLVNWHVPFEFPVAWERVKLVQAVSAGVDGLEAKHIPSHVQIARIVDVFSQSMAEYVLAHLLARSQAVLPLMEAQRARSWRPIETRCLAGRWLGVVGLGSVGSRIVRLAQAVGMRVRGYSRTGAQAADLPLEGHVSAAPGALVEFVRGLHALVLALPLTPETRHVVDRPVLASLGPAGLLINVGRGGVVNESVLVEMLASGELGGAILDVFETEPVPPESPIWDLSNVTVTPHLSGPDDYEGVGRFFVENVHRLRNGEPLVGMVDRSRGY